VGKRRRAVQILDDQQYAFRIEQIQEIVILQQVTRMPQVADYVEGVSNLRGAIIPIINLRKLLGLPPRPVDAETRTMLTTGHPRALREHSPIPGVRRFLRRGGSW
jgi:chemotaxis signal transduction protein